MRQLSSFRTEANWRHVAKGDALSQVCRRSGICLRGWLAEQHLRTVSLSCFPVSPKRSWFIWRQYIYVRASPPHCSHLSTFFILSWQFLHSSLQFMRGIHLYSWFWSDLDSTGVQMMRYAALIISAHTLLLIWIYWQYRFVVSPLVCLPYSIPFCFMENRGGKKHLAFPSRVQEQQDYYGKKASQTGLASTHGLKMRKPCIWYLFFYF